MKKLFILGLFFLLQFFSVTTFSAISQKRLPNESFQQALKRIEEGISREQKEFVRMKETPQGNKVVINEIDYSIVPRVASYEELLHMYYLIRDTRFLHSKDNSDFARRISWLYPDDGCFARAAIAGKKLQDEHLTRPAKVFAFGDLVVETPFSFEGSVSWWYHVAEIVNYMGAYYVLDPALNNQGPLLVEDWFNMMGNAENLTGIVCNAYSYDPFDECFKATKYSDRYAQKDQSLYLKKEWFRMLALGFEPEVLLGDNPPWIPADLNIGIRLG